jgi:hypothetical protein
MGMMCVVCAVVYVVCVARGVRGRCASRAVQCGGVMYGGCTESVHGGWVWMHGGDVR